MMLERSLNALLPQRPALSWWIPLTQLIRFCSRKSWSTGRSRSILMLAAACSRKALLTWFRAIMRCLSSVAIVCTTSIFHCQQILCCYITACSAVPHPVWHTRTACFTWPVRIALRFSVSVTTNDCYLYTRFRLVSWVVSRHACVLLGVTSG